MNSEIRRQWQVALAALLIWGSGSLGGSAGQAADGDPAVAGGLAAASDVAAQAIANRLDAMLQRAAAQLAALEGGNADRRERNADVAALRELLEEAAAQIRLFKNVIQTLRAQSEAEEALRQERAAVRGAAVPETEPARIESQDLMLAGQVEALSESVRRLRADVDALRERMPSEQPPGPDRPSSDLGGPEATGAAELLEEKAMLPEAGMGGRYEPLMENEPSQSPAYARGPSDEVMIAGDLIRVGEVHFNSGSAQLTPGGARSTLEAVERIRSIAPAKVRVVAFTDRVGASTYNLVLSKERALSVAAILEKAGFARDMVEIVGSGEEGIPVPTRNGIPEPLNRSARIFVVRDVTG